MGVNEVFALRSGGRARSSWSGMQAPRGITGRCWVSVGTCRVSISDCYLRIARKPHLGPCYLTWLQPLKAHDGTVMMIRDSTGKTGRIWNPPARSDSLGPASSTDPIDGDDHHEF